MENKETDKIKQESEWILKEVGRLANKKPFLKEAIEILCNALREDEDFNFEWQLMIQNSFREQVWKFGFDKNMVYHLTDEQLNKAANEAAKNFLNLLISK